MDETPTRSKKLLSRAEAADRLNVSLPTLDRWLSTGRLTKIRIGPRKVGISPDDVEAQIRVEKPGSEQTNAASKK